MADLAQEIKRKALELGFQSVGFAAADPPPHLDAYTAWLEKGYHGTMHYLTRHASVKADPKNLLPGAKTIIAVALNYNQPNPPKAGHPHIARYALGRDYHKVIRGKLNGLAKFIEVQAPGTQTRACVDSTPILERDYAQQAGLGWYGKNTCLIDSKRGSWFFIGLLITSLDLPPDAPAVGGCGNCTKCVEACPTGAIVFEEERWQLDARRCISYLTIEHKGALDFDTAGWTFGCDVCQEVCPFNEARPSQPERGLTTSEPDFLNRKEWPSLERLRVIEADEWDILTSGSPVRRTGLEGLRRNAALNS